MDSPSEARAPRLDSSPGTANTPKSPRGLVAGILAGGAMVVFGPLLGVATTAFFVQRAFGAVASADPSEKAKMLADGISNAMNFTIAGMVVATVGTAVALVSLVLLLRSRETPRR